MENFIFKMCISHLFLYYKGEIEIKINSVKYNSSELAEQTISMLPEP